MLAQRPHQEIWTELRDPRTTIAAERNVLEREQAADTVPVQLISWIHPLPAGGSFTSWANCGL